MKKLFMLLFVLLMCVSVVFGAPDFDRELTPAEEAQFDEILEPIMKVYNFIKYAATVIGVMMIVFAGATFIMAGGEQVKKERAKNMAMGVIIGLGVIWVAPIVVEYVFT